MNTLENQRYKELIEKIENLEEKIVDMEHYIQTMETNIIEKNKEWQVELANELLLKSNISEKQEAKPSYLEFVKPINKFERCLDLLNSFKNLWHCKNDINFDNFPTKVDPLMKCLKNKFINMTPELDNMTDFINKLVNLLCRIDKCESLSFGTEEDSPTIWFSEFIQVQFNHHLKDDFSDLFDHQFDYIDLLSILFNITDSLSHIIHNIFDATNEEHQKFMTEIDKIYSSIDKTILSPLEKGLSNEKNKTSKNSR